MRADLTEKLFRAYDADNNGYLDMDEFVMLVQAHTDNPNPHHTPLQRRAYTAAVFVYKKDECGGERECSEERNGC